MELFLTIKQNKVIRKKSILVLRGDLHHQANLRVKVLFIKYHFIIGFFSSLDFKIW